MNADAAVSAIFSRGDFTDQKHANHQSLDSRMNQSCVSLKSSHAHESPLSSGTDAVDGRRVSLEPITPDSNREFVECLLDSSPPLLFPSLASPKELLGFNSHYEDGYVYSTNEDNPCTPKKDVFDPFAPGPDKLMLAPCCKKYAQESRFSVARRLKFDSFAADNDNNTNDKINISEDQMLFQSVYSTLIEAIISSQTEGIADTPVLPPVPDGFETPTFAPRLNGIADTCPRAPVKPANRFRSTDKEICRKLEF